MSLTSLVRNARKLLALAARSGIVLAFAFQGVAAQAETCTISPQAATVTQGDTVTFSAATNLKGQKTYAWTFELGSPELSTNPDPSVTYNTAGIDLAVDLHMTGKRNSFADCSTTITVQGGVGNQAPVLDPIGDRSVTEGNDLTFTVTTQPDTDGPTSPLVLTVTNEPQGSTFQDNQDGTGTFTWLAAGPAGSYPNVTFTANDGADTASETITITVNEVIPPGELPTQTDFKMLMNYELGMHCTGFEFAYCCVLPAYNSILAQVVKPGTATENGYPRLLEGDPNAGIGLGNGANPDVLGREVVLRDPELDENGDFKKYVLRYWHDAQPRSTGQSSTLISNVEGNSLLSWNTLADAADLRADGTFKLSGTRELDGSPCNPGEVGAPADCLPLYNGARNVVLGDGDFDDTGGTFGQPIDNYQNAVWNHLYIHEVSKDGVEGAGGNTGGNSPELGKKRLGLHVDYPQNFGPGGHPMEGLLTYSGEHGTVVYTQMKVLEDLPITLTSPRIWEALGLPLTPFEDSINFFNDPGQVDESSIRPYVQMKAALHYYEPDDDTADDGDGKGVGPAVFDRNNNEVVGFGTAPIDIPNCERCHSAIGTTNSPNPGCSINDPQSDSCLVEAEIAYWKTIYPGMVSGSDWYARLKGAAISILARHDTEHGTGFLDCYPYTGQPGCGIFESDFPQNTRIGHESVICQKCHADNVIAVVKSANCGPGSLTCADGDLIPPLTEALHYNHRSVSEGGPIAFNDAAGRNGGCQGCHPAHRSDGIMDESGPDRYPISLDGDNAFASNDNRDAAGGCFVGRDVHSNPMKDVDGANTPSHLNAVGQWLEQNVANDGKGIWCTNCHQQLGQELWKAENVADLVNAKPGDPGHVREPGDLSGDPEADLNLVLAGLGISPALGRSWLDPKGRSSDAPNTAILSADGVDRTHDIWKPDPGLCDYVVQYVTPSLAIDAAQDAAVAVVEVVIGAPIDGSCSNPAAIGVDIDCGPVNGGPRFQLCGTLDDDDDFNVSLVGNNEPDAGPFGGVFCTTPDCVSSAQGTLGPCALDPGDNCAVPVPMSAATDGRDHWLSPGEPHCADCHAAPYVEQSGNINAFAPFNYPRKASLMRYSRGHQDITCQGCHESIHGLYPVNG